MIASRVIAVTGATGSLGARVAEILSRTDLSQRLIVRDPSRAPNIGHVEVALSPGYADTAAMTAAMIGCETLFMVSGRESHNRVAEHKSAIDAAVAAGIARIVYTSFLNASPYATFTLARDHYVTERYISDSGLAFTFLRDSLYLDVIPSMVSSAGVIAGPAGTGVVACVAREDVAEFAAAVLQDPAAHDGRTYQLTGPEAFTLAEAAAQLSLMSGKQIMYKNETLDEAYVSRASYGAPQWEVDGWVSSFLAIAKGELSLISPDIPNVLGRRAMSFKEYLTKVPESYVSLGKLDDKP